ncbi:heme ABC transporter ATP-binding protein [Consotaella aegiceratis]|uniref:heme ABC transporter ATP-binding protein n=1 Tax=Consotaella aegiceratis TaxID=3097961 RepID=UPI002F4184F0
MLEASAISVVRGGRRILSDVSMAVRPGEVVAVLGANGAGKSTLLKTLSGELQPQTGAVRLDGAPLVGFSAGQLARRRAVLAQANDLLFSFTCLEVVRFGAEAGGAPAHDQTAIAQSALAEVGMASFAGRSMPSLSGGEAQRVHFARTLAQIIAMRSRADDQPASCYLLLDEPTSSLDLRHQIETLQLARTVAGRGVGVLAILHDLNLAVMAADRILALRDGTIIADGEASAVIDDELIWRLYGVRVGVRQLPASDSPFILPQSVQPIAPD